MNAISIPDDIWNSKIDDTLVWFDMFTKYWSGNRQEDIDFIVKKVHYAQTILDMRGWLYFNELLDILGINPIIGIGNSGGWNKLLNPDEKIIYNLNPQPDGSIILVFNSREDISGITKWPSSIQAKSVPNENWMDMNSIESTEVLNEILKYYSMYYDKEHEFGHIVAEILRQNDMVSTTIVDCNELLEENLR